MTGATRDIDRGWKRLKRDLRLMRGAEVKVGIQDDGKKNDGEFVAVYAIFNEFGTEHIPARPFMRRTADEQQKKALDLAMRQASSVIFGRMTVRRALVGIGMWYQSAIQETIRGAGSWAVPNAPSTVELKGNNAPLRDQAILLGAIRYEMNR